MRLQLILFTFFIGLVGFCILPAGASVADVTQGSTVFVGEEGLILNPGVLAAGDTQVAWYPSGTSVSATTVPEATITVSSSPFAVTPVEFGSRTGVWYSYPNGVAKPTPHVAFRVEQPELNVKLWVYTPGGGQDATEYKIIAGDKLGFRMETNLYPIFNRPGVSASEPGIDIYVETSEGTTYSALYDDAPVPNAVPITNQHPKTAYAFVPVQPGATCVWDTGNPMYGVGKYSYYAYANVNGLKDVVGRIEGDAFTPPAQPTPTPEVPTLITGTGTLALDTTTGGIVQTDTILYDQAGFMDYVSIKKGTQALNTKAQRLTSLSLFAVGDPENIGPFPENEHPFSTCFVSPEQSSFSPSAELGIRISDNSAIHNLYWWNEPAGKWYAVDAEMDNNDGFLKAAITKSGYYMMTYPVIPTKATAEPTIPSEPTIPTESTALPTTAQTPLGFLGILTGLGAFALLKKK
ncbi:MAG: DUF3821 domain-containing protein [Methanomicrobiales archaeon]|nr:DUF3821 domain-containing protein [Methanomicrobiales archaeon]